MEMTKSQVARVAKNLLKVIEDHNLDGLKAITEVVGKPLDPNSDDKYHGEEYVEASVQPSNQDSICIVLSYRRRNGQTPIEFRINPKLGYAVILLTCTEALAGYEVFDEEPEFGKMQDKKAMKPSLDYIKSELYALAELK